MSRAAHTLLVPLLVGLASVVRAQPPAKPAPSPQGQPAAVAAAPTPAAPGAAAPAATPSAQEAYTYRADGRRDPFLN
ncbi:MAG: hypothetical protein ACRD2I_18015, partial [Vicinamibacterales bacterium]